MVDSSKRRSLKSLGVMMATPMVPAMAIPAYAAEKTVEVTAPLNKMIGNEELSITLLLGDKPMMRVTNNSDSLSILRRMHPGVVHAGAKSYDLNHALVSSSYAIGAGLSRLIPITEASSISANYQHYVNHNHRPLRLAAITADNTDGRILNGSRAFFA